MDERHRVDSRMFENAEGPSEDEWMASRTCWVERTREMVVDGGREPLENIGVRASLLCPQDGAGKVALSSLRLAELGHVRRGWQYRLRLERVKARKWAESYVQ